ncbi:MAG TPA: hypothetical protein VMS22_00085 [Candidatus Eisenbacteria bacterium]|nr:hypothetical protein [Candidatus Eisenbacteria bacterium]
MNRSAQPAPEPAPLDAATRALVARAVRLEKHPLARRSTHELRAALHTARIGGDEPRIFQTSAVTGRGVPELAAYLRELPVRRPDPLHFVRRQVAEAYGTYGLEVFEAERGRWPRGWAAEAVYEDLEAAALGAVRARLR